jgi:lactate dehydrogenase-like 2-hydroxyacid dehydrogenase
MTPRRAWALQLCPLSAYLEAGLAERFEVIRWFDLDADEKLAWLGLGAGAVRAVVTAGHVGCANELMEALPSLGIVAINGVGFDRVDLELARRRGVRVTTTPGALADDVADLAVGLTIGLLRGVARADAFVRAGGWPKGEAPLARKMTGRRFGIVGLGHIGSAIAHRLSAFGPVAYTGPNRKDAPYRFVPDLDALALTSDVLIVACPATASTRHLVDARILEALGADGVLVNISRGSIVDEMALIAALGEGRLAGAALDVFEHEPHVPQALRDCPNVLLTPHIASATIETRIRMADIVLENLDAFLAGKSPPTALV